MKIRPSPTAGMLMSGSPSHFFQTGLPSTVRTSSSQLSVLKTTKSSSTTAAVGPSSLVWYSQRDVPWRRRKRRTHSCRIRRPGTPGHRPRPAWRAGCGRESSFPAAKSAVAALKRARRIHMGKLAFAIRIDLHGSCRLPGVPGGEGHVPSLRILEVPYKIRRSCCYLTAMGHFLEKAPVLACSRLPPPSLTSSCMGSRTKFDRLQRLASRRAGSPR